MPPRRSAALRLHVRDLNLAPVQRYAEIQRARGALWSHGDVDVDIEQLIDRPFLCDRHRCIQWTPHDKKKDARPLIDRSCCSRYAVPVTDMDRRKLDQILPLVKKRLDRQHPLVVDGDLPAYEIDDDDYSFVMREQGRNVCQFVLYEEGRTTCAIHKTCLEEKLPVWEYKPVGCSLWPVALVDYEQDGKTRYLLTVYGAATKGIFDSEGIAEDDEEHFACLLDKDDDYEPLYKSVEGILTHILGPDFYKKLDRFAKKRLRS
jgi:hypothetical protein